MKYIILDSQKNNNGDLTVTYLNLRTRTKHESVFSEGEHYQADLYLKILNEAV